MSATLNTIRQTREAARERAQAIITGATAEHRALTTVEAAELEGLHVDIDAATDRLEALNAAASDRQAATRAAQELYVGPERRDRREPLVLARGDSFAEHARRTASPADRAAEQVDVGRLLRGMVTGSWDRAELEQRAMSEGVTANGGITLPTLVSSDIIDRARNLARVIQAGAVTVPMPNATFRLPRLDTDPAAAWRNELAAIADVTPTMSGVDLTARSLACLVRVSVELFEDTDHLGEFLLNALAQAFAVEVDRSALLGTGTAPEPRGLLNTAGLPTTTVGSGNGTDAATLRSDWVINGVGTIRSANFEPTATIVHPNVMARVQRNLTSTNDYVAVPAGLPPMLHSSTVRTGLTVGTSTDCSEAYIGQWDRLAVGMRQNLQVRLLSERFADTGEVALVATMRADVAVLRTAAFLRVAGLRVI